MFCKLCNRNVESKFYRHLNGVHRMKKDEYLKMFPEQLEEYKSQVPPVWNKGQTQEQNPSIAKCVMGVKKYWDDEENRQKMSEFTKKRYKNGDILSVEDRKRVVKIGSDAWVSKIKSASLEERIDLLKSFTTAGNEKQKELRINRTPEDYQRLYPFAKGFASWGSCCFCQKKMIIWIGGKPRPKKRFCSCECRKEYQKLHPNYMFSETGKRYFSNKMNLEFYLRSNLERWFAEQLDLSNKVDFWATCPFRINYSYNEKQLNYIPDFIVNGIYLFELKSGFFFELNKDKNYAKFMAAREYSKINNLEFVYWQFDQTNMSKNKFINDERVIQFFTE